ncbi:retrovirus-related Pol polyprotein from transposon opus [Trichonephila clavipes]|nr:retrovirus-related Pol polyprotein from transposon opus [Trichonephila clavipes]
MAFLGKAKKQDLVLLAEELGQKVSDKMTNIELRNIIIGSKDYEEEFVRDQLSVILEERLERESKEKIQQQREFELEKMRLEIERSRFDSEHLSPLKTSVSDLIKIIPNFDIRDGDIVLFLTLFERQAKRIGVEKTNWVSALLARMPPDITQLIARESEDKFDNYDYIKGVLLKRFKMSPETFRQKFMKHQRIPARSWRDFVFKITSYFEEWLDGMEVRDFKSLKDLITDQLKKRVPGEIREHFVDEWAKFYEPSVLADKLDDYESVRSSVKKTSQPEMSLSNTSDSRSNIKKEHAIIKNDFQSQRYKLPFKQEPKQQTFKPTCYSCGRVGHTSRVCHAKSHKETSPNRQINVVETNERFQEQSSAILTAKVAIPVYSPTKEDEKIDELQSVHIKCGNEILKAVIDTGAQISVVRADVVEGQSVDSGGTIQIMSAFGEREVTELKIFNLKIDDSRHGVVPIMCAVSRRLVNDMAVEGITADDPKSISSQEMPRETYPSEIYMQSLSKANEEEKKFSDEDLEVTQAIEKVLVSKGEPIQTRSTDQYAVAQSVVVEKEKEEISVDVIKHKDESNSVILSKERIDFDEDEIEEEKLKLPRRKRKSLSRRTVAELQQKLNLKASSNMVLIPQHWSFRGEYSQDKSGIGKLAWELSDFIKRDSTVNIRRSSRENRSTRKRVRLKLRPKDNIYRDGKVRVETRHLDFKIVDPTWMKQGVAPERRLSDPVFLSTFVNLECEKDYNDDHRDEITDLVQSISEFQECDEDIETWIAIDAEDSDGFQMLNDDENVISVQAESDPVDDETDEDEDNNNESSKDPSNAGAFSALETAMEWYEQQSEYCPTQLLLLKRIRDLAAKKRRCAMVQRKISDYFPQ